MIVHCRIRTSEQTVPVTGISFFLARKVTSVCRGFASEPGVMFGFDIDKIGGKSTSFSLIH